MSRKSNPPCEALRCKRTAIVHTHTSDMAPAWLCGTHARSRTMLINGDIITLPPEKPTTPPRKPNPASATNGTKGGRPRTATPAPDALRQAAQAIREHYTNLDPVTHATLVPVALMLESMANGRRITTPQRADPIRSPDVLAFLSRSLAHGEAAASVSLDKDPDCQTLSACAFPGCDIGTPARFCPEHEIADAKKELETTSAAARDCRPGSRERQLQQNAAERLAWALDAKAKAP